MGWERSTAGPVSTSAPSAAGTAPCTRPTCGEVVRPLPVRVPPQREQAAALTVLQPAAEYAAFVSWCGRAVGADGRPASPQVVLHALVRRLLGDPRLSADLLADMREGATAADVAGYACW